MKIFKRLGFRFWLITGYIIILIACFGGFITTALVPSNLVLEHEGQIIDSSKQIYFANYQQGQVEFTANIQNKNFSQNIVSIQVDDCLDKMAVNGQNIDLGLYTKDRFCSWDRGIAINLGNYLKPGQNQVQFTVSNYGGEVGLKINPNINDPIFGFLVTIAVLTAFALLYEVIRGLRLDKTTTFLFIFALAIRLIYVSYTGFNARQHDALGETGHLGYINYFATNFSLPDPTTGFEYHQPPLYYVIAGTLMAGLKLLGIYNVFDVLQLFSIAFFLIFAGFGSKLLDKLLDKKLWYYLAVCLLLFWPSGIIHSVRITNDNLFWALFAGFIYFLFRWLDNINAKNFLFVCIFFGLGMSTKTSMVLALPMFFVAIIINLVTNSYTVKTILPVIFNRAKNGDRGIAAKYKPVIASLFQDLKNYLTRFLKNTKALIYSFFGLLAVGISFVINPDLVSSIMGKPLNEVIGSTQLNGQLKVGEGLQHYLYFDLQAFVTKPFMTSWSDEAGRQWFWNFFLKSSLFGEFSFETITASNLAILISFCFLIIIVSLMYYFFAVKKFGKNDWLMLAILLIFVAGNMLHRKQNPYAPNSDFRFVLPVLIPFVYFVSHAIDLFYTKKQYVALVVVVVSCLVLILSSISFFVVLLNI